MKVHVNEGNKKNINYFCKMIVQERIFVGDVQYKGGPLLNESSQKLGMEVQLRTNYMCLLIRGQGWGNHRIPYM